MVVFSLDEEGIIKERLKLACEGIKLHCKKEIAGHQSSQPLEQVIPGSWAMSLSDIFRRNVLLHGKCSQY